MDWMNRIGNRLISQARVGRGAKRFAQGGECPYIGHRLPVLPLGNRLYADAYGLSELFPGKPLLLSLFLNPSSNLPGIEHRNASFCELT